MLILLIIGSIIGLILVVILAARILCYAPRGKASRPVKNPPEDSGAAQKDPDKDADPGTAWYIEHPGDEGEQPYSCSFIEFDDRGDYLDFSQHRHAYEKIRDLAENGRVAVVLFVHGWRNSSQSGNVTGFVTFLRQLAGTPFIRSRNMRVHGIYLGWRGGVFKPARPSDQEFAATGFSKPVVSAAHASRFPLLSALAETFLYHIDRKLPEKLIAGTSFSRAIYTCAQAAKHFGGKEDDGERSANRVILIGHSFGGLLLERTLMNATLGELTGAWPWKKAPEAGAANAHPPGTDANPLPFDTVLLVNSAAPSIYAKQFQGYLAAHRGAMHYAGIVGADAPIFISITSVGDWATGLTHPIGNCLAGLSPTLRRKYSGYADYILYNKNRKTSAADSAAAGPAAVPQDSSDPMIPQAEYFKRTPGHNPLLVNRWIEPADGQAVQSGDSAMASNLSGAGDLRQAMNFVTTGRNAGTRTYDHWMIKEPVSHSGSNPSSLSAKNDAWSKWREHRPVCWDRGDGKSPDRAQNGYWIVRCPKAIIKDHNDIWNSRAMETYAALLRAAEFLRNQQPRKPAGAAAPVSVERTVA